MTISPKCAACAVKVDCAALHSIEHVRLVDWLSRCFGLYKYKVQPGYQRLEVLVIAAIVEL